MSLFPATTSQTVGPFFSIGLTRLYRNNLAAPGVSGERVEVTGRVLDGDGKPIPDAIIEIWQANSHGKYAHPDDVQDKPLEKNFSGYGRVPTDEEGKFRFTTIKPGRVPGPEGPNTAAALQAPHLVISLFMRGLLRRLITRMYFPGEPGNADDIVDAYGDGAMALRDRGGQCCAPACAGNARREDGFVRFDRAQCDASFTVR